jgi:DNA-3-methyladenine glycosylase II
VIGLARSDIDLDGLAALPDEEVAARLVALRGIGEWTAAWFLARHLARPRAWPWGDLALRKAVDAHYRGLDVRHAGARFEPFQNLTAHYLLLSQRIP